MVREAPAGPVVLTPGFQKYPWGDRDFIPKLFGFAPTGEPFAEAWIGAHPALSATARIGTESVELSELLREHGAHILGREVLARFGGLPFLLKVLAAAEPLSIQVHPSRVQAIEGFLRDDQSGLPVDAPERRYRDVHHKPELIVALGEFYALCGFRPAAAITAALSENPEIAELLPAFEGTAHSLQRLVASYFALRDDVLLPALGRWTERLSAEHHQAPGDPRYWVVQAHRVFSQPERPDRGLFLVVLLNLIRLEAGQGLYLPAGMLHAYLRGAGVEVMASSDNVLRGGLTSKHVDVDELMRVVRFECRVPDVVHPTPAGDGELRHPTGAEEFELRTIDLVPGQAHAPRSTEGPEVLLVLTHAKGSPVVVQSAAARIELGAGGTCLVPHGVRYRLSCRAAARLVRVSVPAEPSRLGFRGRRPTELAFGTSGLRGLVSDITDLEAYLNTRGFLEYLQEIGDAAPGSRVALAGDLRPSTDSAEKSILRAVACGVQDAGFSVAYFGRIPTPALTYAAMTEGIASVMVTGSHIPFDRNGIKFNKSTGEVLKSDEAGILDAVGRVRRREYAQPRERSLFEDDGVFRPGRCPELPPAEDRARRAYVERFTRAFPADALAGLRVVLYEHSAVGREILAEILTRLGAEVLPLGRTAEFTPIDTEDVSKDRLAVLDALAAQARQQWGRVDAVVSTDGDSDRPLVVSVAEEGRVRFVPGDVLGILAADFLEADSIAVPISATDAVDLHFRPKNVKIVRTRIGSPWVIAAMAGLPGRRRVGWESNGGFLVGSEIDVGGRQLSALPTRDAALPIVCALSAARRSGESLEAVLLRLPARFSKAGLLDAVPTTIGGALASRLAPSDPAVAEADFSGDVTRWTDRGGAVHTASGDLERCLKAAREALARHLGPSSGLGAIVRLNFVDGYRATFDSGEIAHVRPSGNAPQLRLYAVASSEQRAQAIVDAAIAEGGILERLVADAEAWRFVDSVRRNIAYNNALFASGGPGSIIGTVCGSAAAQKFWEHGLTVAKPRFGAPKVVSLHEDLPVNQAFGVLLMWQRLRVELDRGVGVLMAFVFGDGSRAAPFTEAENGQKPAILSTVIHEGRTGREQLSMVEVALRYFAPVQVCLQRSGFDGVVIKWGDEVQIPTRDLSQTDPRFCGADVVRFVSIRPVTEREARDKDWVGMDAEGRVTGFIPRRPLDQMAALADRGLLFRRRGELMGGINLGSIAVSRLLLDLLLEEFHAEVNDPFADRSQRPDLDPQLFSALTIAALDSAEERARAWHRAQDEVEALRRLEQMLPGIVPRLRGVLERFEARHGRKVRMETLDFGDQYWGDIGQHRMMYEYYMALNAPGPTGEVARAAAGLAETRDANGNLVAGHTRLGPEVSVSNSVLIDCELGGPGEVEDSVLIGTRAGAIRARGGFDVRSVVGELELRPRGGSYRIVTPERVVVAEGERATTVFVTEQPLVLRVFEDTDLRDRKTSYDVPILGNPMSFREAHALALEADPFEAARRRARAEQQVVDRLGR